MTHADLANPVEILTGRTLNAVDADLIADLDGALREARAIFEGMMADPKMWATLKRNGWWCDIIENYLEAERTATELCWLYEDENGQVAS